MSLRTFLKSLGGRAGNKTRSRGRVNTKANKRAAAKATRRYKIQKELPPYTMTSLCRDEYYANNIQEQMIKDDRDADRQTYHFFTEEERKLFNPKEK